MTAPGGPRTDADKLAECEVMIRRLCEPADIEPPIHAGNPVDYLLIQLRAMVRSGKTLQGVEQEGPRDAEALRKAAALALDRASTGPIPDDTWADRAGWLLALALRWER